MKKLLLITFCMVITFAVLGSGKTAELTVMVSGVDKKVEVFFDDGSGKAEEVKPDHKRKFDSSVEAVQSFEAKGWKVVEMDMATDASAVMKVYRLEKAE